MPLSRFTVMITSSFFNGWNCIYSLSSTLSYQWKDKLTDFIYALQDNAKTCNKRKIVQEWFNKTIFKITDDNPHRLPRHLARWSGFTHTTGHFFYINSLPRRQPCNTSKQRHQAPDCVWWLEVVLQLVGPSGRTVSWGSIAREDRWY